MKTENIQFNSSFVLISNIKINLMIQNKKLLIGVSAVVVLALVGVGLYVLFVLNKIPATTPVLTITPISGLVVTTDKTEYEQGEIVKITVKNATDEEKKICSPFYTAEKFNGEKWLEIQKVLCPCEVVCRLASYIVLQPTKSTEYEWRQREEWCSDPSIKISTTISNQLPAGRYRVKSYIGAMKEECKGIYSNEFTIRDISKKRPSLSECQTARVGCEAQVIKEEGSVKVGDVYKEFYEGISCEEWDRKCGWYVPGE